MGPPDYVPFKSLNLGSNGQCSRQSRDGKGLTALDTLDQCQQSEHAWKCCRSTHFFFDVQITSCAPLWALLLICQQAHLKFVSRLEEAIDIASDWTTSNHRLKGKLTAYCPHRDLCAAALLKRNRHASSYHCNGDEPLGLSQEADIVTGNHSVVSSRSILRHVLDFNLKFLNVMPM